MKKLILPASVVVIMLITNAKEVNVFALSNFEFNSSEEHRKPFLASDTGEVFLFPEHFEKDILEMMKDIPPSNSKKAKTQSKDPTLSKSGYWHSFDWIKDGDGYEWRYLPDAQLFLLEGNEITGYVYGNGNNLTPFGPSCYIEDSKYNSSNGEFTGDAFLCSSGKIFFFFSAEGRSYLAIFSSSGKKMYSTD
jgi:hypothetical protein